MKNDLFNYKSPNHAVDVLYNGEINPRFVIVACGGAGNNIIDKIRTANIDNVKTVTIKADPPFMNSNPSCKKILIDKQKSFGESLHVDFQCKGYVDDFIKDEIFDSIKGTDVLLLITSLGDGTGTGVAPFVAQIARDLGILTVGIVVLPYSVERDTLLQTEQAAGNLKKLANLVISLDNDYLLRFGSELHSEKTFSIVDTVVENIVTSIIDSVNKNCSNIISVSSEDKFKEITDFILPVLDVNTQSHL